MLRIMTRHLTHLADEQGAVVVTFAVFAPVAILLAVLAIDTGNWFVHSRHLQLQADAGALATAQAFETCFTSPTAANSAITAAAEQYSGMAGSPLYNRQINDNAYRQPSPEVHEQINKKTFYGQSSPVDSTAVEQPPCEAEMVDLKLTQTNLPWYWHLASVANINAHARVEILQTNTARGIEPLAVSETNPVAAAAYFVDEDNNDAILAQTPLTKQVVNGEGQDVWSSTPLSVTINHPHIGVVIALSGKVGDTTCGHALVLCFDNTAATGPSLLHIQGWGSGGVGSYKAPIAREVTLQPGTCSDPYFAANGAGCSIGVTAKINLGATPNPPGVKVSAVVGGKAFAMAYSTTNQTWSIAATPGIKLPNEGANQVDLEVTCNKNTAGSPCAAENKPPPVIVKNVQRAYAAGEGSGSIRGAWVSEPGAGEPVPGSLDADSYEMCSTCKHKLAVTVDVAGSLAVAAGYADTLRHLRFEGEQGVRAGCPPSEQPEQSAKNYETHLAQGCPGTYIINTSDPGCTANASPYDCLKIGLTGKDTGPTKKGIDRRIVEEPPAGTKFYCENNWKNNNNGGVPIIPIEVPNADSRLIQVFISPYGSVDAEGKSLLGNEEIPIQNFAAFYVTGFPGDPCASDPHTGNAEVVGHFVKYINPEAVGGEGKCVANSLGECVAVLTR
jgi:Putative Flp pilus-assembly TadE/G-like